MGTTLFSCADKTETNKKIDAVEVVENRLRVKVLVLITRIQTSKTLKM
jgi:hypothetical protein